MSDGCGKTCACPSAEVAYEAACCAPNCPNNGTCGGADGCGSTCGCAGGGKCTNGLCPGKVCAPTCGCSQTCNNGQCVPVLCDPDVVPCGCGCCNAGEACIAGQCTGSISLG
jgi:hypothetical protein